MTPSELHQSWARTEAFLRDARKTLPGFLAEKHAAELLQFDEFLVHNELGLAADWLTSIAAENPRGAVVAIESLISAERSMGRAHEQSQLESLLMEVRTSNE